MIESVHVTQHNTNGQKLACHQLRDLCAKIKGDIVLIQEPAMCNGMVYGFEDCRQILRGDRPGAAIVILDPQLRVIELADYTSQYIATAKISKGISADAVTVVSAYFKYNMPTHNFTDRLRPILERNPRAVIGTDVNGHSPRWHCPDTNDRGRCTEDLITDFNLAVANKPSSLFTYDREGMGASNIDVTLTTPQIAKLISDVNIGRDR